MARPSSYATQNKKMKKNNIIKCYWDAAKWPNCIVYEWIWWMILSSLDWNVSHAISTTYTTIFHPYEILHRLTVHITRCLFIRTERRTQIILSFKWLRVKLTRKWEQYFRTVEVIAWRTATGNRISCSSQCKFMCMSSLGMAWLTCEMLKKCMMSRGWFAFTNDQNTLNTCFFFISNLKITQRVNIICF